MKEQSSSKQFYRRSQKALLRWYENRDIYLKTTITKKSLVDLHNPCNSFMKYDSESVKIMDSLLDYNECFRVNKSHEEYQKYLLSKQLEFKKYFANIFYLNKFALKLQHGIFKLCILNKLKTAKCPCCNKPRNPNK